MREFELLAHIFRGNAALPPTVVIPPGDDMGALRIGDQTVLVTVDQIGDGIHVDLATMALEKVARKAITRNLSDVAAMAAKPLGAVAAACLPRDFGEQRARALFDHMSRTAAAYQCPLIGGDIAIWDGRLLLTVTIFAEPAGIKPVLRRGAKAGDAVYVTGWLGGSLETVAGYTHHLDFEPRLALARQLGSDAPRRPNCMIDLSDGLARDLGHLCEMSNVRAEIWTDHLPLSAGALQVSERDGEPAWLHGLRDGEDYELCFTVEDERAKGLPREIDGAPLTMVGRIVAGDGRPMVTAVLPDGSRRDAGQWGWEHTG